MRVRADRRGLRTGYTTGACAAAAAKAALLCLTEKSGPEEVRINLPGKKRIPFKILRTVRKDTSCYCSVIKDAGDDPDVTNGAEIGCEVTVTPQENSPVTPGKPCLIISGGEGVGIVTKPGLPVPVGSPAINPVPKHIILEALKEVIASFHDKSFFLKTTVEARIIVPEGRRLARKTLNARLGVLGGISILGTTGIVEPFSLKAYQATIDSALDILTASGCGEVVLTPGRNSEKVVRQTSTLPEEAFVVMGDHAGYALAACIRRNIDRITIAGRLGKLSKIAFGHFKTHAYDTDLDFKKMALWAGEAGGERGLLNQIESANTMAEVVELVSAAKCEETFSRVALNVVAESEKLIEHRAKVRCTIFNVDGEIIASSG